MCSTPLQGLTYVKSTGHFFVIEEAVDDETHGLVPYAQELKMNDDDGTYKVSRGRYSTSWLQQSIAKQRATKEV
jgi:hypothetical protein